MSEPAVFVAKVAKRRKNPLTFSGNRQQAHENIQNIRNNRSFEKRKTYLFRNIFLFRNIPNERALREKVDKKLDELLKGDIIEELVVVRKPDGDICSFVDMRKAKEHDGNLLVVLRRLRKCGSTLNYAKCQFRHDLSKKGISSSEE